MNLENIWIIFIVLLKKKDLNKSNLFFLKNQGNVEVVGFLLFWYLKDGHTMMAILSVIFQVQTKRVAKRKGYYSCICQSKDFFSFFLNRQEGHMTTSGCKEAWGIAELVCQFIVSIWYMNSQVCIGYFTPPAHFQAPAEQCNNNYPYTFAFHCEVYV